MKRKRHQGCVQKPEESCDAAKSSHPQFLQGLQCHVHPAGFGSVRHKIFENHVKQYGGELVPSLPEASDAAFHIVFEESVDEEKVKRLVKTSQLPNSIFLKCTWLVECVKSKARAETEDHLIMPVKPAEIWKLEEGTKEDSRTQNKDTDRALTEELKRTQTDDIEKTLFGETHVRETGATGLLSKRSVGNSEPTIEQKIQDEASAGDSSDELTAQLTSCDQTKDPIESQSSVIPSKEDRIAEYQEEPLDMTVGEAQVNKLLTCTTNTGSSAQDIPESLIRPFPKNLQVSNVLSAP